MYTPSSSFLTGNAYQPSNVGFGAAGTKLDARDWRLCIRLEWENEERGELAAGDTMTVGGRFPVFIIMIVGL